MQEESGSVVNTPATVEEKKVEVKNKKASKKKEAKIPTVNDVVEKESPSSNEKNNSESEDEKKSSGSEKLEVKEEKAQPKKEKIESKQEANKAEIKAESSKENAAVSAAENSESSKQEPKSKEQNKSKEEVQLTEDNSSKNDDTSNAEKPEPKSEEPKSEESDEAEKSEYPDEESEDDETAQRRENLNLDSETALIETILFLESEPQNTENLSKISQLSVDVVNEALSRLREKYSNADSGIEIAEIIGGWMLVPKKESFDLVKEKYGKKNEGRLSKAAIETLSIIAYSQPITRAEIESIRHVNADNMMRILFDRKFIKEVGKKDIPGKPILYGTTKEFLEFFHLQSISDLPQLDEKESERFELAR